MTCPLVPHLLSSVNRGADLKEMLFKWQEESIHVKAVETAMSISSQHSLGENARASQVISKASWCNVATSPGHQKSVDEFA